MHLPFDRFGAIHDLSQKLTWAASQLTSEVARRAEALDGVGPGMIVAITHGGSAAFFADLFAVWSRGAAAACLDPSLTAAERVNIIAFCKPALVLSQDDTARTGHGRSHACADGAALILFTSGTTGAPKGVVLSSRAIEARLELNRAEIGNETLTRSLVTLPTHFGHGLIGNALTPLFAGGDIVLVPRGLNLAQRLGPLIDEHDVTFMSSVPSLWQMALRLSPLPARRTLRRVHVGSAPLSATTWQRIRDWCRCPVVNCYGITETANWIAGASSADYSPADGFVGKPWGGAAAVVTPGGRLQAAGAGEIAIKSPALMSGYLARPDLTAAVLNDGWYRTGDLGEVNERGEIRLTGRAKDEINRAGFKVQPAEIDMLLERHPAVAEACTFSLPDAVSGEVVAVAVRLAPGAGETAQTLRAWCLERVRREAAPERWFFVDEIPRTSRGKVSRDSVRRSLLPDAS
jgi:acyl-CoA synthetase (AMP-forming)/AMP-acid ligase II